MIARFAFVPVLALLALAGVAVSSGTRDDRVDLSSAMELWGDVLRDADGLSVHLLRVSDADEMRLGAELASRLPGELPANAADARYVTAVTAALTPHVRRYGIRYTVHVVQTPVVNACALPGGQLFLTTGLLTFVTSEAELASIVAHEIAHVDERHAVARYEYAVRLRGIGAQDLGKVVDLARDVVAMSYTKYQEADADTAGLRLVIEAGYEPDVVPNLFARLAAQSGRRPRATPSNPLDETGQAVTLAMGSYLASHPSPADRATRLSALVRVERRHLAGLSFYRGVENYRRRIPRDIQRFPGETNAVAY